MYDDGIVQSTCNFCFGPLELRNPKSDDPDQSLYKCKRCGRKPTQMDDRPRMNNLAKSYAVRVGMKKGVSTF